MTKKKIEKKTINIKKLAERARREKELKDNGRLLSLRPSLTHNSKKSYTRKPKHKKKDYGEN